jgi:phosphoglycolate phosphatase-like HAD superfamily hydrolase
MKLLFHTISRTALISVLFVIATTITTHAQDPRIRLAHLDYLAKKASETVDVNIDERLIQLAAKLFNDKDEDEAKVKKLVNGLKGIYVKSFEFENENDYSSADVDSIRSQLREPAWSRLVNVTSKRDGVVEVYIALNGSDVLGLAVLSAEPKELTVVNIVGPVDLEKLAKLEGNLGIPDLGIEPTKHKTKNEQ